VDSGWGGIRPRLQHIITLVIYTDPKISSSDSAGEGVVSILTILSRLSFIRGSASRASACYARWEQNATGSQSGRFQRKKVMHWRESWDVNLLRHLPRIASTLRRPSTMLFDFFAANANRAFEHYQVGLAQAWEVAVAKETASETLSEHIENMETARNVLSYEGVPS
jgi:hypothetical protein